MSELAAGKTLIDTRILPCNTSGHVDWSNTTNASVLVVKVEHLFLVSPNAIANVAGTATRISDGSILSSTCWDHYDEPTGLSNLTYDFSPDYFAIAPGDGIRISYNCATISGTAQFEQMVAAWY
jgi:hypothetical protein